MVLSLKLKKQDEIRRILISENITFSQLQSEISQLFGIKNFSIRYIDEEGDQITIQTNIDLEEAIRIVSFTPSKLLVLIITENNSIPTSTPSPQPISIQVPSSQLPSLVEEKKEDLTPTSAVESMLRPKRLLKYRKFKQLQSTVPEGQIHPELASMKPRKLLRFQELYELEKSGKPIPEDAMPRCRRFQKWYGQNQQNPCQNQPQNQCQNQNQQNQPQCPNRTWSCPRVRFCPRFQQQHCQQQQQQQQSNFFGLFNNNNNQIPNGISNIIQIVCEILSSFSVKPEIISILPNLASFAINLLQSQNINQNCCKSLTPIISLLQELINNPTFVDQLNQVLQTVNQTAKKQALERQQQQQQQEKQQEQEKQQHCAYCDICKNTIRGIRYKCLVCDDFDLCEKCEQIPNVHNEDHSFIKIRKPLQGRGCFSSHSIQLPRCMFINDVNIEDGSVLERGVSYSKKWTLKNTGQFSFPEGCRLIQVQGSELQITSIEPIDVIAPSTEFEVTINFIAPQSAGQYRSTFMLTDPSGKKFGEPFWILFSIPEQQQQQQQTSSQQQQQTSSQQQQQTSSQEQQQQLPAQVNSRWASEISLLRDMGFTNIDDLILYYLDHYNGNVMSVLDSMLSQANNNK